ncbi:metal-binding protein ZinT [Halomonas dongshanensis]|uniref:Metal-binding protein ZinT n=1 Tax=Halomonas dongshanensis TaxID=2890835 RepID=A0ABT2EFT4_9GAMM|nr:metal-binding protein ZinT [Halomonas dongshanensis]MCS2610453.1 metal-binding protein ZinT [Halomonas dongshanensis]
MSSLTRKGASALAVSALMFSGIQVAAAHDHSHDHDHSHEHSHDHGHDHEHSHSHEHNSDIHKGIFEDEQVQERELSDWEGDWQSVYPYLQDGTLDEVFEHKADTTGKMSADEYKEYYTTGYETDVERIVIDGDTVTFFEDGQARSADYHSDGYEILTYEAGNRGVRFIFETEDTDEGMPRYIQFSDHDIYPTDAHHFHLYWGDDREALLEEVTHWPTYYPSELDADGIVSEMKAH